MAEFTSGHHQLGRLLRHHRLARQPLSDHAGPIWVGFKTALATPCPGISLPVFRQPIPKQISCHPQFRQTHSMEKVVDQENRLLPPFYHAMSGSVRVDQPLQQSQPGNLNLHQPSLGAIPLLALVNRIENILYAIDRWRHRRQTRDIHRLSDRQLDDIALTRADIGFRYTEIDRMLDWR